MNRQFVVEFSKTVNITEAGRKVAASILNHIPDEMEDDINEANEDFLDYFNDSVGISAMDNYEDYLDAIAEEIADAIKSLTRQDLVDIVRGNKNACDILKVQSALEIDKNEEADDEEDDDDYDWYDNPYGEAPNRD